MIDVDQPERRADIGDMAKRDAYIPINARTKISRQNNPVFRFGAFMGHSIFALDAPHRRFWGALCQPLRTAPAGVRVPRPNGIPPGFC